MNVLPKDICLKIHKLFKVQRVGDFVNDHDVPRNNRGGNFELCMSVP